MGMNSAPQMPDPEGEEYLKRLMLDKFSKEGYSAELEETFQRLVDLKYKEGDEKGGTVEERIRAQVELFKFGFEVGRNKEETLRELDILLDEARQQRADDLGDEIDDILHKILHTPVK